MSEMEQQPICKIALGIEYDGSKYYGWQRQNEVRSVQEKLEKALSQVANEPITVFCAGRTDAGVHGTGRCISKPGAAERCRSDAGVNANLPVTSRCVGSNMYRRIFTPGSAPRRAAIATSSIIIACVRRC
ncbi:hypothetical protein KPZU09_71820 [Klebsiella pneumoniae]|uniref:tRNA pseudouridine synthase n=1 Tax=Klebsiella pneumoniae TaxID=573 RepID=A0A919LSE6_KLEPN|nr:hypothetical protein KPZU09_71820 [Klebsiella pneumoniae]